MTTPLEQSLATTLEAEVLDTAAPDAEFFIAVHRRVRRRRRRRRVLVAGCAGVLVVAMGAVAALAGGGGRTDRDPDVATSVEPTKLPEVDTTKLPDFANLPGPRDVWPDAVSTLPGRLPDGRLYKVRAMLPDNRYLVISSSKPADYQVYPPNGYPDALVGIFDVGRNTFTPLSDPNAPAGTSFYWNMSAGVVGDYAMWYADVTRDQKEEREVWSAKLTGGSPRKLVTLTADTPNAVADAFGITRDGVTWRLPTPGLTGNAAQNDERRTVGFYRIGPTGGTPELVPGSEGFTWAPAENWLTTDAGLADSPATGELWNRVTGERRPWTRNPAAEEMRCGPLWCGGTSRNDRPAIQKLDGSGYVELPPSERISPAYDGRLAFYVWVRNPQDLVVIIWDLSTGRASRGSIPDSRYAAVSSGGGYGFTAWEQDGQVLLLNYAKIK
jgi:hypothetical protein